MFFFIKIKQFTSGCCNLITKRQTDRGGQTDREADRQTDRETDRQICRQTDGQTGRRKDRQRGGQTDREGGLQIESLHYVWIKYGASKCSGEHSTKE